MSFDEACHVRRRLLVGLALWLLTLTVLQASGAMTVAELHTDSVELSGGRSDRTVTSVRRDRIGMLWIGSRHGLMRFDGYTVTAFEHDESDPASLSSNYVRVVFEDRDGTLWIGTNGGGLDRFDAVTSTFDHFRQDATDPNSLSDDIVYAITQDLEGRLWIGTPKGLNRLDLETNRMRRFVHDPSDSTSLARDSVISLYEDRVGTLWVGTVGGGLCRVDSKSEGRFTTFRHAPEESDEFDADAVFAIAEDSRGGFWLGTEYGLSRVDVERRSLRTVRPGELMTTGPRVRVVTSLIAGNDGVLWVGAWGAGVHRLDTTARRMDCVLPCREDTPQSQNRIAWMDLDDRRSLWVGSWDDGLGRVRTHSGRFEVMAQGTDVTELAGADVLSVAVDSGDGLWVGAWGGGLFHRHQGEREFRRYFDLSGRWTVRSILPVSDTEVWFGSTLGLHRLDPTTSRIEDLLHDPSDAHSLGSGFVDALLRDRRGTLWVGTGGGGLGRMRDDGHSFDRFVHRADDPSSLGNDHVTAILEDRGGRLWVGTRSGGLNLLDPDTMRFTRYLPATGDASAISHRHVTTILEDSIGRIWIGTAGGGFNLVVEEAGELRFERFTTRDGLTNDDVMGMVEDRDGSLWISTGDGLSRFRLDTRSYIHYNEQDGLPTATFSSAAARGLDRSFFGTSAGLVSVPHSTPLTPWASSPVVLTSIRVLNGTTTRDVSAWSGETLAVSYGEVLSFEFAVLDLDPRHRHRYAYRLENVHDDWIDVGSLREVTFANLAPGKYLFHLRGRNAHGVWSEADPPLDLRVIPPFWMTTWFRMAVIAGIFAIAFGGHYVRTTRLERRNRQLRDLQVQKDRALMQARASEGELQQALRNLRRLTARLESVQENERRHLARELHDELGQALTAAKINVKLLRKSNASEDDREGRLDDLVTLVDSMIRRVRELSINLRPPLLDELGLAVGLRTFVENQGKRAGVNECVTIDDDFGRLPAEIEIVAFRVVQEAVTNVIRHAHANRLEVAVRRTPGYVELTVEDDGPGFDVATRLRQAADRGHVGLIGMRERVEAVGGSLEIRSSPGEGTLLRVRIPLQEEKASG